MTSIEVTVTTNDVNSYDVSSLNYIRDAIQNMNKFNQLEVLHMLSKKNQVMLNENKYGVHVNLKDLPNDILDELSLYIKYVSKQETIINSVEKQKEEYINTYFNKDKTDKTD
jgi:hypothetical protein